MRPFTYLRAQDVPAALAAAAQPGAAFVAGGTDLLNVMRDGAVQPSVLIDLNTMPAGDIAQVGGHIRIPAMARMREVAEAPLVNERLPVLKEAVLASASPQVRNMATVGGNLLQRTRCWYFRDPGSACNKRQPGSGCPAINGNNRWHAVLGGSDACIAVHPSDIAVALTALDAAVLLEHTGEGRRVPLEQFYLEPADTPHIETVLRPGELVVAVDVPTALEGWKSTYIKVRDRASFEFALVSVAMAVHVVDGIIDGVRIALGGIATRPWRPRAAENVLLGNRLSAGLSEECAALAVAGASGRVHNLFKIELARRVIVSGLNELT